MSTSSSPASSAAASQPVQLDQSLDTPGPAILHLEHVNLEHPSAQLATLFYTSLLSLTLDPHRTCSSSTLWFDVGQQQFHIQCRDGKHCKTAGAVGLVLGRQQWDEIEERWQEMQAIPELRDTQLSVQRRTADPRAAKVQLLCEQWNVLQRAGEEKQDDGDVPYYHIVGPWGQLYEVYSAVSSTLDERSMGLAYIEEILPADALADVVQYYRRYFHTAAELLTEADGSTVASVTAGNRQRLLFRSPPLSAFSSSPVLAVPTEASWHYAIYVGPFAALYQALEDDGLVHSWSTGRSDCVNDWSAAKEARQYRGFDMQAGPGSAVVWRLEQEVRSSKHRHYDRRLVNERQMRPKERWNDLKVNGILPPHA